MIESTLSETPSLPTARTLVELLRARAERQPEQLALTFLRDGVKEDSRLTYAELDRRARGLAARLQALALTGERAMLLFEPGLEFVVAFFGCLYANVVAVPAYTPGSGPALGRFKAIVENASPRLLLTTPTTHDKLEGTFGHDELLGLLPRLTVDASEPDATEVDAWLAPAITGDHLAFLQYTSGSTSTPKGVMVSHQNLLYNAAYIREAFQLGPESISVSWLPAFHDMGLIDGILQPIFTGFPGYLMAPVSFLQRPLRWLQAISHYRATHCGGPNFAYELLLKKIKPEQIAELDLSCWLTAYNGAEPVRGETLARFSEAFRPAGFSPAFHYPCYGLAEATLMVTGGLAAEPPLVLAFDGQALEGHEARLADPADASARLLVSSGRTHLDTRVQIVDPETRMALAPCAVGEIWVAGPTICQGYWLNEEQTQATMAATLADHGPGVWMRTGDLGFLWEGELFVTGRLKDLVIIRGRNHYPQDIERTIEASHTSIRMGCSAAFAVDLEGEERLVVVAEVERRAHRETVSSGNQQAMEERMDSFIGAEEHFEPGLIVQAIRQAVGTLHEVQVAQVVLIKATTIPKTSSGKIQRRACRLDYLAGRLVEVAARA